MHEADRTTRLAPSPTGALHLGNARTFLLTWALARQRGWKIVLRIEDLDGPRIKTGAARQAIEDLRWLGLDWDEGPYYQVGDQRPYEAALKHLQDAGQLYPCACTRREIAQAQSAPHDEDRQVRYPGTCRPQRALDPQATIPAMNDKAQAFAWRVAVPDEPIEFVDELCGEQRVDVQAQVGDFVVATKDRMPAYQLAVVVDDSRQGITDVVRGCDLVDSTGRQLWLYQMLGYQQRPRYWHVPLVLGPDGRRLAKRHGDTRLVWYREQGVHPQRVVALLARWSNHSSSPASMTAAQFADSLDISRLPAEPVCFRAEDHAWLLGQ